MRGAWNLTAHATEDCDALGYQEFATLTEAERRLYYLWHRFHRPSSRQPGLDLRAFRLQNAVT